MKFPRRVGLVAACAAMIGLIAACGAAPVSAPVSHSVTLVGGIQSNINWWFPVSSSAGCSTTNATTAALLYRPLIYISNTDGIDFTHSIASSIGVTNHDQTFTVHLNPKWHWSNGAPVTSQDAAYSFAIIKAANNPKAPWNDCFTAVGGMPALWKSVTTPNSHTLVVTTTKPVGPRWFEHNGLAQLIPIPKTVWDKSSNMTTELSFILKVGAEPTNPVYRVVDGPYHIGKVVNNEYWTLLANPHYDGHRAAVTKLVFEYETSTSSEYLGLRKGEFATATLPNSYYKDRGTLLRSGYQVTVAPYSYCENSIFLNMYPNAPGGGVLSHLYVRQALEMGINQNALIKHFALGLGQPEYGPIPPQPKNQFYDPHLQHYPFNIHRGTRLLESHGWQMKNGVLTKNGKPLELNYLVQSGSITQSNMAEYLQSEWAQEGIKVTLTTEPFNQEVSTVASPSTRNKWDMFYVGYCYYPNYYPSGTDLYTPGGGVNFGGYSDPAMTRLLDSIRVAPTAARGRQLLDRYQQMAATQLPALYMPQTTSYMVTLKTVHGVPKSFDPITEDQWFNRLTLSP